MRINDKMKLRNVAGENIILMQNADGTDMTRVVALNESALLLYNRLMDREFELDDVVHALVDEYEVSEDDARKDAEAWVAEMRKNALVC